MTGRLTNSKLPSRILLICRVMKGIITAIRPKAGEVGGSLRFSLGRATTKADIDHVLKALEEISTKQKKWYN